MFRINRSAQHSTGTNLWRWFEMNCNIFLWTRAGSRGTYTGKLAGVCHLNNWQMWIWQNMCSGWPPVLCRDQIIRVHQREGSVTFTSPSCDSSLNTEWRVKSTEHRPSGQDQVAGENKKQFTLVRTSRRDHNNFSAVSCFTFWWSISTLAQCLASQH